jgi:hypothetical protein
MPRPDPRQDGAVRSATRKRISAMVAGGPGRGGMTTIKKPDAPGNKSLAIVRSATQAAMARVSDLSAVVRVAFVGVADARYMDHVSFLFCPRDAVFLPPEIL